MFKIVILNDRYESYAVEHNVLASLPAEVIEAGAPATEADVIKICKDADAILVNLTPLTASVIEKLEKCKVISRYGVGYDNVDVEAATKKKILVTNVPDYCVEDVSDHAVALLLSCVRRVAQRDREIRRGKWDIGRQNPIYRMQGKTIGLAGFGRIPRAVYRKLSGFQPERVLAFDPFVDPSAARAAGVEPVDFETLLKESDLLSIHVPLTKETKHLFNSSAFQKMKTGAIVVNTSRGGLIDTEGLIAALNSGKIRMAGLDVFEEEPLSTASALRTMENVVMTDHIAWYSEESQDELQTKAAESVKAVLLGAKPLSVVNPK